MSHNSRKRSFGRLINNDNRSTTIETDKNWKNNMHINSMRGLKGSDAWFDKMGIDYDGFISPKKRHKENVHPTIVSNNTNISTPNKHSNRFSNTLTIQPTNNPTYVTRLQRHNNTVMNKMLDMNRLNQILTHAQTQLSTHITNVKTDMKHRGSMAVVQLQVTNKHRRVGRYVQAYCSQCDLLLHEELSHPNLNIQTDDKKFKVNQLDIQYTIASQESRMKWLGLTRLQFILGLPTISDRQYWKYVNMFFVLTLSAPTNP